MRFNLVPGLVVTAVCVSAACGPSQAQLESERARVRELKAELAEARKQQRTIEELEAENQRLRERLRERERVAEKRSEQFCNLMAQLQQMIDSGKIDVRVVRGRMVVELPEDVLFPSGQAQLKKSGRKALGKIAPVLSDLKKRDFQVAGHTDNLPIDNEEFSSNWELSTQRAVNVTQFLTKKGLKADRLAATGYAATRPVSSNETEEGRAQNRRIEIMLMPNLEELPDLSSLEGSCE
jgi:chemotaxis protein MotB